MFGGLGLLAAFPLAFAIIIPATYFPILVMLLALVFRGVAFEFRFRDGERKTFWDHAFSYGSGIATFAQGVLLGSFIQGYEVTGRALSGSSFSFLTPFSILTGIALLFGYGLLGAGWLILKTEGDIQSAARRHGRVCLVAVLVAIAIVSIWTPLANSAVADRWFAWPNILLLAPLPIATAAVAPRPRQQPGPSPAVRWGDSALCLIVFGYCHQSLPNDRSAPFHFVGGRVLRPNPGVPPGRYPCASTCDLDA